MQQLHHTVTRSLEQQEHRREVASRALNSLQEELLRLETENESMRQQICQREKAYQDSVGQARHVCPRRS